MTFQEIVEYLWSIICHFCWNLNYKVNVFQIIPIDLTHAGWFNLSKSVTSSWPNNIEMEWLRLIFLRHACRRIRLIHWIHRCFSTPRFKKSNIVEYLHDPHSGPFRIFLWGFTGRDNASYPSLSLCFKATIEWKRLSNLYYCNNFFYWTGEIALEGRNCSYTLARIRLVGIKPSCKIKERVISTEGETDSWI